MLLSIAVSLIPIKMTSSDLVMLGLCLISESILSLVKFNPCFLVLTGLSPMLLPILSPTFLIELKGIVTVNHGQFCTFN